MRWQKGYTLIEILVALTIIGILFGFGYINYRDFGRRQALAGLAKQVQGDLRLAQQMALSGQKPPDTSCGTLDGIRFGVYSETQYRLRAQCNGGVAGFIYKDVTLPNGFKIAISGAQNPIIFNVLGRGTNITGGSEGVVLTQLGTSNAVTVTVTSGGEIR